MLAIDGGKALCPQSPVRDLAERFGSEVACRRDTKTLTCLVQSMKQRQQSVYRRVRRYGRGTAIFYEAQLRRQHDHGLPFLASTWLVTTLLCSNLQQQHEAEEPTGHYRLHLHPRPLLCRCRTRHSTLHRLLQRRSLPQSPDFDRLWPNAQQQIPQSHNHRKYFLRDS